jgi:DNA-binding beta-propeller fold protein YncE
VPDFTTESLRVLDFATHADRGRVSLAGGGPQGLTVTPDSRTVFISLSAQGRVAIVDLESLAVTGYLPAGDGPDGVAFSPLEQRP